MMWFGAGACGEIACVEFRMPCNGFACVGRADDRIRCGATRLARFSHSTMKL
jgi:hypothetical protein